MQKENIELKKINNELKSHIEGMMRQLEDDCEYIKNIIEEGIPPMGIPNDNNDIDLTDLDSDAIYSIKTTSNVVMGAPTGTGCVSITYQSNRNKVYKYTCSEIANFKNDINSKNDIKSIDYPIKSFGRYVHKCITEGTLSK